MRIPHVVFNLLLGLLAVIARGEESTPPLLLANYYTWYHDGTHPDQPWAGWTRLECETNQRALAVQREGEPPRSSAATPVAGLYSSADPVVADWHVRLAKAAGVDAFLVDWWGTHKGRDRKAELGVIPAAERHGMKFAILDERAQFHREYDDYEAMALDAMDRYFKSPSYLTIDGEPVYYLYQVASGPALTIEEFSRLRTKAESIHGPIYWVLDSIEHDAKMAKDGRGNRIKRIPQRWLNVPGVDAFGFYSTFSNFRAHRYEQLAGRYRYLTHMAHQAGKAMLLPVHPGHDNSHFRDDFYLMPRREGQTLRDYLRAATEAEAEFVMITSWNEWPETTVIEPAMEWEDPYQYLKIIAEWKGVSFTAPEMPDKFSSPTP